MRIAVLGATGAIGSELVAQARAAGHDAVALPRDPAGMRAVLAAADAVLSAIGPRTNTPAAADGVVRTARDLCEAMAERGVARLVLVSGAATDMPGDRKRVPHRIAGALIRRFARHVVDAKQRELEIVVRSRLEWTAVRPPRVLASGPTSRLRVSLETPLGLTITRGDLAAFMLAQTSSLEYAGKAPFVSN